MRRWCSTHCRPSTLVEGRKNISSRLNIDVESPENLARSEAGRILKQLHFGRLQRRIWLDARMHLSPEELVEAARQEQAHRKNGGGRG